MRKRDSIVIWPCYFDSRLPRHKGRKVSFKYSVESPTIEHLIKAASKLRLNFRIEKESRHPRYWWLKSGRLIVKKTIPKYSLLKRLGEILKKLES